jgi:hypothetical protein
LSASDGIIEKLPKVSMAPSGDSKYGPMDSPFKMVWSRQHSEFIVAGGKTIYSFDPVSEALVTRCGFTTQTLSDMDVSPLGDVAIGSNMDGGTTGFVRVVGEDFWKLVCKRSFPKGLVRAVSFANEGKLVVATESSSDGTISLNMVDYLAGTSTTLIGGIVGGLAGLVYDDISKGTIAVAVNGDVMFLGDTFGRPLGKLSGGVRFVKGTLKATAFSTGAQTKVRICVGSRRGLSDRWDSGEVSTAKTEALYGGGDNLVPGQEYWVTVMVCYEATGWSIPHERRFWVSRS